jgi:hypothetical protein
MNLSQHVDGYSYLPERSYQVLEAVKTARVASTPHSKEMGLPGFPCFSGEPP